VEVVQIADDLAGSLPVEQAAAARRALRDLRVAVFYIRTVREQMRYDVPRIVVEAGKPFSIVLENTDFMPHNLVVLKPGAREKIGPMADKMKPDELDARGRPFVPRSPDILEATKLVEPGQQQTLKLTAPKAEGTYEYCCTFPEHWRVMWGQLIVTSDVEAYLKDHPDAPLPAAGPAGHQHHSEFE
jgi:azurin